MQSIGIDTGGTFTDLAVFDSEDGEIRVAKVPSSPDDPAEAVQQVLSHTGDIVTTGGRIVHGTTVATNVLLEHKGAKVAVITTEGFRDLLEIGRTRRASPGLFNTKFTKNAPLVPRSWRLEVNERMLADGKVLHPLDEASVDEACDALARLGPEVVAICFLHAYANPSHESQAEEMVKRLFGSVRTVLSSHVVPEYREFERLTTTVINAYVLPRLEDYLLRLAGHVESREERFFVMGSNGGILTAETAAAFPARTILSGPAGGVNGAALVCEAAGVHDFITCDMGGTSTDVSLIREGAPTVVQDSMIAGLPLKLAQLDINTIGAGGGSVAWLDVDGSLAVGPLSAGADPGPACYGRGGAEVTVTDANLALGRLDADTLLGGAISLNRDKAAAALQRLAGMAMYKDQDRLAEGVILLASTRMANAIREISTERGHDPRQLTLVPMGGAGPMHAADIAKEMGIARILVPRYPGNLSALGLLSSDIRYDLAQTVLVGHEEANSAKIHAELSALSEEGLGRLIHDGFTDKAISIEQYADMRYRGQAFDLTIPVITPSDDVAELSGRFEVSYEQRYGHRREGIPIDIVTLRVVASGQVPRPSIADIPAQTSRLDDALKVRRPVYLESRWNIECPVYDRARLGAGAEFSGPAIIEELGSTTVLMDGWQAHVDNQGNLRLQCRA